MGVLSAAASTRGLVARLAQVPGGREAADRPVGLQDEVDVARDRGPAPPGEEDQSGEEHQPGEEDQPPS